jgi:hypothetical protein
MEPLRNVRAFFVLIRVISWSVLLTAAIDDLRINKKLRELSGRVPFATLADLIAKAQ